jgi:hypothetical protein
MSRAREEFYRLQHENQTLKDRLIAIKALPAWVEVDGAA